MDAQARGSTGETAHALHIGDLPGLIPKGSFGGFCMKLATTNNNELR
ncbi:MAG: hypothetical protein KDI15_07910 [Thiothrix sp.]|nr:hypothetical protein [Thiothrix sp.]HPE59838.1 hypothetical protein [Thiolinea sp.]